MKMSLALLLLAASSTAALPLHAAAPAVKANSNFIASPADLKARIAEELPHHASRLRRVCAQGRRRWRRRHRQRAFSGVRRAGRLADGRVDAKLRPRTQPTGATSISSSRQHRRGPKTWTPPRIIAGPKKAGDGYMASWGLSAGRAAKDASMCSTASTSASSIRSSHHTGWLHGIYSDDNGTTWSKPQRCARRSQHQRQPRPNHAAEYALLAEAVAARQGRQVPGRLHPLDQLGGAEAPRPSPGNGRFAGRVHALREHQRQSRSRRTSRSVGSPPTKRPLPCPVRPIRPTASAKSRPSLSSPTGDCSASCALRPAAPSGRASSDGGETWAQPAPCCATTAANRCCTRSPPARFTTWGATTAGSGRYCSFIHDNNGHYHGLSASALE